MKNLFHLDYEINRNESIMHDLLRIFLLFQVVIGHLVYIALPSLKVQIQNISENYFNIVFSVLFKFGPESAFMFVFLSGYMVAGSLIYSLLHKRNINDKEYFYKRVIRIFPLTILVLIVTLLFDFYTVKIVGDRAINYYESAQPYNMVKSLSVENFFGNLFFLQPTFIDVFGSNGPLWTLGYLFQYYIIGWIFYKIFKINFKLFLVSSLLILTFMLFWKLEWFLLFLVWVIGGVIRNVKFNFGFHKASGLLAVLFFSFATFFTGLYSIFLVCISGILLIQFFRKIRKIGFFVSHQRFLRRIANDSFAVYLVHYPVIISIYLIFFHNVYFSGLYFVYYIALSIFLVIGLSFFLILIEKYILAKI